MTYKDGFELKRKEDGTYYVPKRKMENSSEYAPADYKSVDKKCKCKKPGYCTNFLSSKRHGIHICSVCRAILPKCRVPCTIK
jgi:hypothetical protein